MKDGGGKGLYEEKPFWQQAFMLREIGQDGAHYGSHLEFDQSLNRSIAITGKSGCAAGLGNFLVLASRERPRGFEARTADPKSASTKFQQLSTLTSPLYNTTHNQHGRRNGQNPKSGY